MLSCCHITHPQIYTHMMLSAIWKYFLSFSYFGTKIIAKYENMRHKENFDQYCTKHFTITTLLLNAC